MSKFHISTLYCMETQELFLYERRFRITRLRGYQGYWGYRGYDGPQSRGPLLIKFKVARLQGYQLVDFFLQIFRKKRLRGYQGYRGYRGYRGYDGPLSRGPLLIKFKVTRLQGYQRVEFFLQFLE